MKKTNSLYLILSFLFLSQTANALDYFWVGGSGMWSDHQNHWATSSGGSTFHDQVPTSMDNVYFDANSFPTPGGIVTIDQTIIYCMDMDWTGATGTPRFEGPGDKMVFVYGSFKLIPDMQWMVYSEIHFASFQLGNQITTAEHSLTSTIFFEGFGGEWTLQDEFETETSVYHYNGILRTNDQTLKIGGYWNYNNNPSNYQTPEFYLGTSTLIFKGYSQAWFYFYGSNALDADEAKVIFDYGGYIYDNGHTFMDVTFRIGYGSASNINVLGLLKFEAAGHYTGGNHYIKEAEYLNQGSLFGSDIVVDKVVFWGEGNLGGTNNLFKDVIFKSNGNITDGSYTCLYSYNAINSFGQVVFDKDGTIYGDNIFESLKFSPGETYIIQAGTIQTITALGNFIAEGTGAFPIEIKSCQLGEQATFHKDGDPICLDFLYLTDMVASGTGFSYAGANSDDVFNNSGWIFDACPACFTEPPLPALALDPISITSVLPGEQAKLVLANVPAGYKVVWFDETQNNELYSNVNNNFQPFVTKSTIFYGGIKDIITGCVSEVLAVTVCAPTIEVASENISCEGSAQIQLFEQSGQGAAWSWAGPAGFSSSDQNPIILNPGVNNVGDYQVVMTDAYGCTIDGVTHVSIYNTFSIQQLPVSCYNAQQYIRFLVKGIGAFNVINNGNGVLSTATVAGGEWFLLTGLNDYDSWSVTVSNPNFPLCTETLTGTLGLCPDAPDQGCNDPVNVSNNTISDESPVISGDYVAWSGYDGQDWEVFLFNTKTGVIENVTNNDYNDYEPKIDGDYMVWRSGIGPILYHIPSKIKTNIPFYNGWPPEIKGDYVVGVIHDGDFEIEVYQISTSSSFQITNNSTNDWYPKTDGRFLTWTRDNGSSSEVFSYDLLNSGPTIQVTSAGEYNYNPEVEDGRIVWFTGSNVIKEYNANNSGPVVTLTGANEFGFSPKTDGSNVVWHNNNQGGLVLYDLTTGNHHKIPGSTNTAGIYQIYAGKVVWPDYNPYSGNEIFCYDIASNTTTILSNSPYTDYDPATNGSIACWSTNDGTDNEIFVIDFSIFPNPPMLDLLNSDTTYCNPFKLVLKELQPGDEVVWYDNLYAVNELYSGVGNDFQPKPTQETTYYGGFRNTTTGCISKLIPVTLQGKSAPTVSCPNSTSVGTSNGLCGAILNNLAPTDLSFECPTALNFTISGATSASGMGDASGQLFSPGQSLVTYLVKDSTHNTGSCIFYVNVYDTEPPTINCETVVTLETEPGFCYAIVQDASHDATASDNCPSSITLFHNFYNSLNNSTLTNGQFYLGSTSVQWTAVDGYGNYQYCNQLIVVQDQEAPVILDCPQNIVTPNSGNQCGANVYWPYPGAIDNCGIANFNSTHSPGAFFPVGETQVTYFATDYYGNQNTCSFQVTVVDQESPNVQCKNYFYIPNDPGQCQSEITTDFFDVYTYDNCGIITSIEHNYTIAPFSNTLNHAVFPVGLTTVIWSATDNFGNVGTCEQYVFITDAEGPVIQNCPVAGFSVPNDPGQCSAIVNWSPPTASDNCGISSVSVNYPPGSVFNVGSTVVAYIAYDINGNSNYCTFSVEVLDLEPPTVLCPANVVFENDPGQCEKVVLTNAYDATITDNCPGSIQLTHDYPVAPENTSFAGTTFPVGVTFVHWQAVDIYGNINTCEQTIIVQDFESPNFLDCPAQMIMVNNDPNQCSAKVNWSQPVALDNCGLPSIVQVGGPISGSILTVSCPNLPILISYLATDGFGNTAVCNFEVLVMESESPQFDADIVMPGNATVDCDAVPDNLVYHGLTLGPLTPDDVSDNCTPSADLNIQFAEQSTQSSDPATCGYYTYTLTRTWTITDCAGNSLLHQQLIQVQDTTKPVAICLHDTVALNDFGQVVIDAADLAGSSYDNCASGFLSFSAGQTTITCADLSASPLQILVTVADPCGNTSTCFALVDVTEGNGKCTPEYDFSGSDPCVCLDNATNQDNGQFSELIQIHALAGQSWTVLSSAGLYLSTSPAPPVVPAPVPNGALLTNGSTDGIDNDGDNQTDELDERVYYTLRARHVDGQGYSAILRNTQGNQIQLENKCYYPSPYFTDELFADEPLCLGSAPFTIKVAEYNNAAGQIVQGSVMVDGLPTSVFDASALGLGAHTIMATFDAGMAQPFLRVNGMVVEGSEAEALADPGCKQKITKVVNVVETPTALICDDLVYVAIDDDCQESLNPDEVLEGTYFCLDDYIVEVDKTLPYGNGPWVPADLNASDIGKQYQYRVVRITGSANICWGEIKIEDKILPSLDCPDDITIACSESTDLGHTGNVLVTDCSVYTTVVDDVFEDNGECGAPRGYIHRTWLVTDAWGNQSACSQRITLDAFELVHVVMPSDITVDCETAYLNTGATAPDVTGRPSINGAPIGQGGYCAASISFTDERFDICSGSYSIHRTWKVSHECLPLGPNNPVVHIQRIRVKDFGGPAFVCPPAVTVSTNPYECCATAALPKMIVSEGCSNISNLEAKVTGVNPLNGNIITFTVGGHLEDFPGNNYWNPDTLAVFDYTQCMPLGDYTVQYKAQDDCSNISYCQFILTVADLTPPTVSCDQVTQVALTADGVAAIPAANLNDGTTDNCCLDFFEVRRMDGGDCTGTDFAPDVQFCCSDIGDTVMVVFRAWDCHGNSNDCMVSVLVEDKIKPACQPPANVSVNCENFDPSLWSYGIPDVLDNCCLDTNKVFLGKIGLTHSANYALFDTVCNKGTITRTFRAFDCSGNSSQCTQRVFVTYLQDYYVKFPNDAIVTTCDGTGNFGEPLFFGEDCELLGVSHTDEIFTVVPDACFKIERTWQIINWCTFNPNLPLIEVPNPNPNPVSNASANLPGPTVSACGTIAPWAPTVVKINPTDLTATNYCTFWQQDANGYKYKQI
ncbi:MAG TPA: HYR domain-containing protein, partial [Saprospiraceae bacterium]|nr:HYR domain-containing protein [Saprospiraceae bacterium]